MAEGYKRLPEFLILNFKLQDSLKLFRYQDDLLFDLPPVKLSCNKIDI